MKKDAIILTIMLVCSIVLITVRNLTVTWICSSIIVVTWIVYVYGSIFWIMKEIREDREKCKK